MIMKKRVISKLFLGNCQLLGTNTIEVMITRLITCMQNLVIRIYKIGSQIRY